ncbi:MAG: VOC family protein [Sphaerobacter sp.]|nr:VOC family protein [Sphaerobacter sp.]
MSVEISPYLNFDGRCAKAFRFYAQVFGGTIEGIMTFGESPMAGQVPPEWHDRVMHARLVVRGQALMGSDSFPGQHETPRGIAVSLVIDDLAEAERIFNALAENGTVTMPFEETFWAAGFGMLVDRFGTPWLINCERGA